MRERQDVWPEAAPTWTARTIAASGWTHAFGSSITRVRASPVLSSSETVTRGPDLGISMIRVTLNPCLCEQFLRQLWGRGLPGEAPAKGQEGTPSACEAAPASSRLSAPALPAPGDSVSALKWRWL